MISVTWARLTGQQALPSTHGEIHHSAWEERKYILEVLSLMICFREVWWSMGKNCYKMSNTAWTEVSLFSIIQFFSYNLHALSRKTSSITWLYHSNYEHGQLAYVLLALSAYIHKEGTRAKAEYMPRPLSIQNLVLFQALQVFFCKNWAASKHFIYWTFYKMGCTH